MAKPLDLDLKGQAAGALGFAAGVVAVPALGLGSGAVGLVSGGPKGALTAGAHTGTNLAQQIGGQEPGDHSNRGNGGNSSGGGGLLGGLF
ncbi:hypothetical protein Bhyg_00645, partial [Pseudolycoriella hygida]